ncbi:biopolymer transporter ExbD [uncultured Alistipes sp.]|uniref:M56 family metallopeptidase n=1 Tax=uncultured Alistipes sp. TaxID=538949 RepID=UPI00259829C9|nr:biopolymer transporter ExbD [uncultured Alistipes sp.]
MKSPALYLLEVFFCSGMLLAFYRLLLVRKVSFAACRRYLVAAVLLSVTIPALDIPFYPARTVVYPLPLIAAPAAQVAEGPFAAGAAVPAAVAEKTVPAIDWARVARIAVAALYLLTAAVSLAILAVRILGIRRLRRRSRITDCGAYAVAENPRVGTPFSFLRTVFLGDGYSGRRREIVVCHEASHVLHRHSAERIALELVRSVFWFNPFVWIAGRWLSEVQEWEADRDVLDAGYGLTEYRTIIFRQLFGYNPDIACGLNHSLTKKRFAMMTQFTKHRFAFVRFGAAIPVVAGMMMLCSFTTKTPAPADPGMTARVHISADGTVTFNGRPISRDELADYVAAERAKLPEADRAGMQVHLTSDGAAMQDRASIRIASDGSILLNGDPVAVAQLEPKLTAWRGDRSPADVCVSISAGKEVKMGVVTDIKQALRAANILRVMYNGTDERMVMRMLPSLSSSSGVKVVVDVVAVVPDNAVAETVREDKPLARPEIRIKERNVFLVLVNGKGKVMAGTAAGQEVVDPRDLTARVEAFVLNASDDPGLSEKVVKQFDLPGGGRMEYPESQGIVSLQTTRDTPFDSYLDIQNRIAQAFDNIRAGLAQRQFGKPYGELSDAERQVVTRAVPLKVSEAEPRMLPGR